MDRFVEDGSLDDNVESFLSHDDTDPRDSVGRGMDVSQGKQMQNADYILLRKYHRLKLCDFRFLHFM